MDLKLEKIISNYPNAGRDYLIPILQNVQDEVGYISREAVVIVGKHLDLPASKIYGVATFYNQFRFHGLGKYHIQICRGTACHVKGSAGVLDVLVRELKINPGETTRDGVFSLEVVACIGACGLAPVISVNGEFYAEVTPEKIAKLIDSYRGKAVKDDSEK